ncbi:hypothetical protein [Crenothrix sp.]|uniref:hypothetical protein n=1 Tax=Crenothrix sp. TaxID=3100433 RepID=UPI00374CEB58
MYTKKTLAQAIFVLGLLLNTPTYASIIVIDNFSVDQQPIKDSTADNSPIFVTNEVRTLSHNLLTFSQPPQSAATISYGVLNISNGIGENSQVTVSWLLKSDLLFGAKSATFDFASIKADNPTNLKFLLNNAELVKFGISANTHKPMSFALSSEQLLAIKGGGTLALEVNGASGWDLSVDAISFPTDNQATNIPEPALMGLVGISLTALSFAHKKRS